jgi:putative DNA primase/helicase
MDSVKYELLLRELYGLMEGHSLSEVLERMEGLAKVDAVQDLFREALKESSLGMFNGVPYCFAGKIYEAISWSDFGNLVYDIMKLCKVPFGFYGKVTSLTRICRSVVESKVLKVNNSLMVFNNCVYDTETGQTHGFDRKWVQVTKVNYDYVPDDRAFIWLQFLEQVLPDKELQELLQEFLGSIFIDRQKAKIETLMILYGNGSNGKSVVYETITGILGKENVTNFPLTALMCGEERKKNIAYINGKRLNYCSEINTLAFGKDSDVIKGLISGEPVEARVNYGNNFTARNIPLMMANTNKLPKLIDDSWGMRRRLCIVPFYVEIPKESQRITLADDLRAEYSGVFNWIMEGRRKFIEGEYKLPYSVVADRVLQEYSSQGNTATRFMFENGYMRKYSDANDVEPAWIKRHTLYLQYKRWCFNHKEVIMEEKEFYDVLTSTGYELRRKSDGLYFGVFGALAVKQLHNRNVIKEAAERRQIEEECEKKLLEIDSELEGGNLTEDEAKTEKWLAKSKRHQMKMALEAGAKYGLKEKEGKLVAKGTVALAKYLSISPSKLGTLMQKKVFEGMYTINKFAYYFDVDACVDALREYDENCKRGKKVFKSALPENIKDEDRQVLDKDECL